MKNISFFIWKFSVFGDEIFVYLNRRNVYIMYHAQISMKFVLLINLKLLTTVNCFLLNIAEHENVSAINMKMPIWYIVTFEQRFPVRQIIIIIMNFVDVLGFGINMVDCITRVKDHIEQATSYKQHVRMQRTSLNAI